MLEGLPFFKKEESSIPSFESGQSPAESYPILHEIPKEYENQPSVGPFNIIDQSIETLYDDYQKLDWRPIIVQHPDQRYYIHYIEKTTRR